MYLPPSSRGTPRGGEIASRVQWLYVKCLPRDSDCLAKDDGHIVNSK